VVYKEAWRTLRGKRRLVSEELITKVLSCVNEPWWVALECATSLGVTAQDTVQLFELGLQRTEQISRSDHAVAMIRRCLLAMQHTHTTYLKLLQIIGRPYDAEEFSSFIQTALSTVAQQFGTNGCVECLALLFQRH